MTTCKVFLLDTSVLLYDKTSIHSFPESEVVIPIVVLDEIDKFKERIGILGENARYVNRFLDDLRKEGSLHKGIKIKNNQIIKVDIENPIKIPKNLDPESNDNKILAVALNIKNGTKKKVTLITKDINLRVKADSLNIEAEDYYKDRIINSKSSIYSGISSIEVDKKIIDDFYKEGTIREELIENKLFENEFLIAKNNSSSFLGVKKDKSIIPIRQDSDISKVLPKNKEQKFAIHGLLDDDIKLMTITGAAGTGKTYITLMTALSKLYNKKYKRIVITRTLQPVGRGIGYLPGDINDKVDPWMGSICDNFIAGMSDRSYFESMKEKGEIEIVPISLIRGRTFNDCFIIVDEAQNSSIHELKTIITRVGENSKIVLLGDLDQIDTPYLDTLSCGLTVVVEKMKKLSMSCHVSLIKGERSGIATAAAKIL